MRRKTNCDRKMRRNEFRVKNPNMGRFLHISAEISKFKLQSLGNPQVTSRLVLPLKIFYVTYDHAVAFESIAQAP